MPKFMNAELERIRDNLTCGHCAATFKGSDSQAWKVKYEKKIVYCSTACRHAALRNRLSTPIPNRGPCKTCGNEFFSRTAKIYCSMTCYVNSEQFKGRIAENVEKSRAPEARRKNVESRKASARAAGKKTGETVQCLECSAEFYKRPSSPRRFCTMTCYRSFLAKRFDRWVANPEGMALPQCYDEFLDREVLPCVIEGCNWKGRHLTLHVNQTHGIKRDEFKRAAGFNLGTGVIAKPLAEKLQSRFLQGVALSIPTPEAYELSKQARKSAAIRYRSAEGREHSHKARAMAVADSSGPERVCAGCGVIFRQSTPFGRALYCSVECRDTAYAEQRKRKAKVRSRDESGKFIWTEKKVE